MPSFYIVYKKEIDSLLNRNKEFLSKVKHLIIDMRANTGGVITTYENVLPLIYTNPIWIESSYEYSSPENIIEKKSFFVRRTDSLSAEWYSTKNLIERMERNPNTMIRDTGFYIRQDSVYSYPAKVSILVGKACGSAGELFLISAMQSKKVTLFGENSYGAIDRADAGFVENKCTGLQFTLPTSLRVPEIYKKPIDNIGIVPNVRISHNSDWVDFVIKYQNKRRK